MKRTFADAPCPTSLQVTLITLPCLTFATHLTRGVLPAGPRAPRGPWEPVAPLRAGGPAAPWGPCGARAGRRGPAGLADPSRRGTAAEVEVRRRDVPLSWRMSVISSLACSVSDWAVIGLIVNADWNAALLSSVSIWATSGVRSGLAGGQLRVPGLVGVVVAGSSSTPPGC